MDLRKDLPECFYAEGPNQIYMGRIYLGLITAPSVTFWLGLHDVIAGGRAWT